MCARLPVVPKLEHRRRRPKRRRTIVLPASATACNSVNKNLIFLPDSLSKKVFLADSGASLSIVPYNSQARPFGPTLRSASGASISAWGYKTLQVKFGQTRFTHRFLLADVANPILGMDFFTKFNLLISPPSHKVLFLSTLDDVLQSPPQGSPQNPPQGSPLRASQPAAHQVDSPTLPSQVEQLLRDFPGLLQSGSGTPHPKHGVEHVIETTGRPVFAKHRRLDPDKLRIAKEEFRKLELAGIIRRSDSPWASPLHMVKKTDGSWRPCGDYRRLNNITTDDRYPLPNMQDLSSKLAGCTVFSRLDLVKGYHQVPLAAADIPKTAIITPFGLYEYVFMPFGLKNAAQSFQRLMDRLLTDIPHAFVYLDDILIGTPDVASHLAALRQVFDVLDSNGLAINFGKCDFLQEEINFLGHRVSAAGVTPLGGHVEAIRDVPRPTTPKELQRFLGMVNFYRRFLPAAARTLRPLTECLKGNPKVLEWSDSLQQAFDSIKTALAAATPLAHPLPLAELSLATDASDTHIGAVLQQKEVKGWRPLGFFSKKLSTTEGKYSAFDRELLAAFQSIRHFRYALEGRQFQLWTDHKPLLAALHRVSEPWTPRQQRQLSFIAECTSDVIHVPGVSNVVADALSRPPAAPACQLPADASLSDCFSAVAVPGLDYRLLAAAQLVCPEVAALRAKSNLQFSTQHVEGHPLLGDISTGVFRPIVPTAFKQQVFETIHGIAHPGTRASRRLILSRFVWKRAAADVTAMARACLTCQQGKIHKHVHVRARHIPVPSRRFSHVHVDLVGPLPTSEGFTHLFTVIDRTTRWAEAIPLSSTSAQACARALFRGWIARFGVPATMTSDRGSQFTSALWSALCSCLGIQHVQTTAYHPEGNGMVERFHRRLKDALRARCAAADWADHLPWVMLGLRSAAREDTATSPSQAVFGSAVCLPGQFSPESELSVENFLKQMKMTLSRSETVNSRFNTAANRVPPAELPAELLAASHVLVRRDGHVPPLSPLYDGPYVVLERHTNTFTIQMGDREEVVSTGRLKPCRTPHVDAAQPRRRGRPPGPVGQSGLPPRCPTGPVCTPPAHPRAGERVEPHGWPLSQLPLGRGSNRVPTPVPAPGSSPDGSSTPGSSSPGSSTPGSSTPGSSTDGSSPPGPSSILSPARRPPGRPQHRVRFHPDPGPPPAAPAGAAPGSVFPGNPAGVLVRPGAASTSGRPPRVRRPPQHLDLFDLASSVWGSHVETCRARLYATKQQQPANSPCCRLLIGRPPSTAAT